MNKFLKFVLSSAVIFLMAAGKPSTKPAVNLNPQGYLQNRTYSTDAKTKNPNTKPSPSVTPVPSSMPTPASQVRVKRPCRTPQPGEPKGSSVTGTINLFSTKKTAGDPIELDCDDKIENKNNTENEPQERKLK